MAFDADPLPRFPAYALRGAVRCIFPLASLLVLAGLLYSPQGRDVLRSLVSVAVDRGHGHAIGGLVFLMMASAMFASSVWYAMRWLTTAQMRALPLPRDGPWQTWLPRVSGAAVPLMVAAGIWGLNFGSLPLESPYERRASLWWALGFVALAVLLLVLAILRGGLITRLIDRQWLDDTAGRATANGAAGGAAGGAANGASSIATRSTRAPTEIAVDEPLPPLTRLVVIWSLALSMTIALLLYLYPVTLPRVVGAAALAAMALAAINLFGSFLLTYAPLRLSLPPLWLWALLLAGVVLARCNDNHTVRPVTGAPALSATAAASAAWAALPAKVPADGRAIFVASEGGGIRAAYWTAAVLDALDAIDPTLKQRMVLLSGVSGGSLGLAGWLVSHRSDYCRDAAATPGHAASLRSIGPPRLSAAQALSDDFVAPAVSGMFNGDLIQRFLLPWPVAGLDRSQAIEAAWQRAFAHLPGQPMEHSLAQLYQDCPALPELVLNATRVETGQRVPLTRLPTAGTLFTNSFDAMAQGSMARRQSLAGLVHHSARFPVVSPPGTVAIDSPAQDMPPNFRLVDGGYFDNSGVESALDAIDALRRQRPGLQPLLLLLRNEPEPIDRQRPDTTAVSRFFPETGSLLGALLNVRGSHAVSARARALRTLGDDVIDLVVPETGAEAPLGWALSLAARRQLDKGAVDAATRAASQIAARLAVPVPVATR